MGVKLFSTYGLTETGTVFSLGSDSKNSGYPLQGNFCRIINDQIYVKGKGVAKYVYENKLNKITSWYNTGDLGFLKNGNLIITGRSKELINKGGIKISSLFVESLLRKRNPNAIFVVGPVFSKKYGEDIGIISNSEIDMTDIPSKLKPRKKIIFQLKYLKSSLKIDRKHAKETLYILSKKS